MHIIEAPRIRLLSADLIGYARIPFVPHIVARDTLIIPKAPFCPRARAAGVFPLRLSRQIEVETRLFAQCPQERGLIHRIRGGPLRTLGFAAHIIIRDTLNRAYFTFRGELRRIRPHHAHPLFLRDLKESHIKRLGKRDFMVGIFLILAHNERARVNAL